MFEMWIVVNYGPWMFKQTTKTEDDQRSRREALVLLLQSAASFERLKEILSLTERAPSDITFRRFYPHHLELHDPSHLNQDVAIE